MYFEPGDYVKHSRIKMGSTDHGTQPFKGNTMSVWESVYTLVKCKIELAATKTPGKQNLNQQVLVAPASMGNAAGQIK